MTAVLRGNESRKEEGSVHKVNDYPRRLRFAVQFSFFIKQGISLANGLELSDMEDAVFPIVVQKRHSYSFHLLRVHERGKGIVFAEKLCSTFVPFISSRS